MLKLLGAVAFFVHAEREEDGERQIEAGDVVRAQELLCRDAKQMGLSKDEIEDAVVTDAMDVLSSESHILVGFMQSDRHSS